MTIGRGYLHVQVREFLGQVQDQAELVRQQTAALPRYDGPLLRSLRTGQAAKDFSPAVSTKAALAEKILPSSRSRLGGDADDDLRLGAKSAIQSDRLVALLLQKLRLDLILGLVEV